MINPSRKDILSILKNLKDEVEREYAVKTMGVFGSVARDEQAEGSDVDLLVEFSRPVPISLLIRLEEFLSGKLGRKVDLVTPDTLKPVIRQDVLAEVVYV